MNLNKGEVRWRIPEAQGWSPEQYLATKMQANETRRVAAGLWLLRCGITETVAFLGDRIDHDTERPEQDMSIEYFNDELLGSKLWPMMTAMTAVTGRRSIRHPVSTGSIYMSVEERRRGSEAQARIRLEDALFNLNHEAPYNTRNPDRFEGLLGVIGNGVYHLAYAMRPIGSTGPLVPKTTSPPLDYV